MSGQREQLWLELAQHHGERPNRLLIFLHGAGSTPEAIVPLALAWQYKFPRARALVLQGLRAGGAGEGLDWFDGSGTGRDQQIRAHEAAEVVAARIAAAQQRAGLDAAATMIVGFSQGASLALEIARLARPCADIVVAYAGRLLAPLRPGTAIWPSVHLLHGELDSVVLAQHSVRAFRALRDAGARVSLDILTDGIHSIGQDMVNVGTSRALQTIYEGRKRIELDQYSAMLTVSTDTTTGFRSADDGLH
ncbi:MAG: alpha/beta fold hydrolase [Burkholderiaceae bacterium]